MRCPITGKKCIMPKEILVTENKDGKMVTTHMCRECGDKYIENLNQQDVVTKSLEVISSDALDGTSRMIIDNDELAKLGLDGLIDEIEHRNDKHTLPISPIPQIKKIEAKLQEAIDEENYETAAKLRDILDELKSELDKEERTDHQSDD